MPEGFPLPGKKLTRPTSKDSQSRNLEDRPRKRTRKERLSYPRKTVEKPLSAHDRLEDYIKTLEILDKCQPNLGICRYTD